jgi:hypothetical protein
LINPAPAAAIAHPVIPHNAFGTTMPEQAYVQGWAVQIPWWAALPIIVIVVFGAWKLIRLLWATFTG